MATRRRRPRRPRPPRRRRRPTPPDAPTRRARRAAYPQSIEDAYVAALVRFIDALFAAAVPDVVEAYRDLRGERRDNVPTRSLPDSPYRIIENGLRIVFGRMVEDTRPGQLPLPFGTNTNTWVRRQHARLVHGIPGIDPYIADPWLEPVMDAWARSNTNLIRGLPDRVLDDIERGVVEAWTRGELTGELRRRLEDRHRISRRRAELIARDQIGKLNGQLHGIRQVANGVDRYRWRTSRDSRVRQKHADREGVIFLWSTPPEDGHPGYPINCRCRPEPVIDDLLTDEGLQKLADDPEAYARRVRHRLGRAVTALGAQATPAELEAIRANVPPGRAFAEAIAASVPVGAVGRRGLPGRRLPGEGDPSDPTPDAGKGGQKQPETLAELKQVFRDEFEVHYGITHKNLAKLGTLIDADAQLAVGQRLLAEARRLHAAGRGALVQRAIIAARDPFDAAGVAVTGRVFNNGLGTLAISPQKHDIGKPLKPGERTGWTAYSFTHASELDQWAYAYRHELGHVNTTAEGVEAWLRVEDAKAPKWWHSNVSEYAGIVEEDGSHILEQMAEAFAWYTADGYPHGRPRLPDAYEEILDSMIAAADKPWSRPDQRARGIIAAYRAEEAEGKKHEGEEEDDASRSDIEIDPRDLSRLPWAGSERVDGEPRFVELPNGEWVENPKAYRRTSDTSADSPPSEG